MKKGQRTEKANQTRARILEVALESFKTKGFDKTTMRDIAREASLAVGTAYYYFRTKEEIVLAFYAATHEEAERSSEELFLRTSDFRERVEGLLEFKFKQLLPYRKFIGVLAASAADQNSPLSPFSAENKVLREGAIALFERAMEGSNVKVAKVLRPKLPQLLWMYQMGLVFHWNYDNSKDQSRSARLMEHSLVIIMRLIRLSTFPLLKPLNQSVVNLLEIVVGAEQEAEEPEAL